MRYKVASCAGDFVVVTFDENAPLSAKNFQEYVDRKLLDSSAIKRIVNQANDKHNLCKIDVIQWEIMDLNRALSPIPHESTSATGIIHRDGTLSLGRTAIGSGGCTFFICVGDQPQLDYGGLRHPDGKGFSAFGKVVEGMDVVRSLHSRADTCEYLDNPIPIFSVTRIT